MLTVPERLPMTYELPLESTATPFGPKPSESVVPLSKAAHWYAPALVQPGVMTNAYVDTCETAPVRSRAATPKLYFVISIRPVYAYDVVVDQAHGMPS